MFPTSSAAALSPDLSSLPNLVGQISKDVSILLDTGDVDRHDLIIKCQFLVQSLETPRETMLRHCWAQAGTIAAINFGVASGLWTLMTDKGDKPQKVVDLAASLSLDANLLRRLMRHLGAMGHLMETSEDEYKPTHFSKCLSLPCIGNGYLAATSCISSASARFHEFSCKRAWENPSNATDTSLMYAYSTDLDLFSWLQSQGYGTHFNDLMVGYHLGWRPWLSPEIYPVQERLIDGADCGANDPFLVDIGGNVGKSLLQFKQHFPNAPGKLILQDLPTVIRQIVDLDSSIICMEHDFHNDQPVKGARAYYLRSILHDWPDDVCETILSKIKAAMRRGYSRLLINEKVVPATRAPWEVTSIDMMMLTLLSSEERTEKSWRVLIEDRAGLKVTKIWNDASSAESLIECEMP